MKVFKLYLLWIIIILFSAYLATRLIPYLGFFPYGHVFLYYKVLPFFIKSLANFDGVHYILIARNGYTQFQQAFFPLYPLLIRFLSPILFNNQLLTGLLISNVCFLLGLIIFYKYQNYHLPNLLTKRASKPISLTSSFWPILFLLTFPTSFFFTTVYTEGLFFFLTIATLYFLEKENYRLTSFFAFFAALTKLTGLFLIIPIGLKIIMKTKKYLILNTKYFILLLSPIIGFATYCSYLLITTGDPFFFFHSQPAFGANRSTKLILLPQVIYRYIKILITANHDFRYFISLFELVIFCLVFTILIIDLIKMYKRRFRFFCDLGGAQERARPLETKKIEIDCMSRLGLNLFSLTNLILPTLTGTFSSIPRYALMSLSFFIFLGQIKNNFIKIIIAIIFSVINILMLGFFIQGYFVS